MKSINMCDLYKQSKICIFFIFLLTISVSVLHAQKIDLNKNWEFVKGYEHNMQKKPNWQTVTLPHTWNALDVKEVYVGYYRGLGIYKKMLDVSSYDSKKHFFLKFDASATVTDVFVNEKHVYHHKGGYTGFTVDITDFLDFSKENELKISVNNAYDSEVMPLVGDFNIYGGLHRPVSLLIKNPIHFDLSNYGSSGVFISQEKVDAKEADLKIHGSIANKSDISKNLTIESTIWDTTGKKIVSETTSLLGEANKKTVWSQNIRVKNPHLWNGVKNPYRYQFKTFIKEGNKVLDSMVQPIGLRSYKIDVDKGFFLNGAYYDLKGVCYHEAKKDKGSALTKEDYKEDFDIMMDMGVTAIRTAHYPHSPIFYNMCDSLGVVVYTEIPQVGPGGYEGPGFINSKGFKENGKQQLKEMIRQNYNRPSIFFWGLFNELKIRGDDPHDYVKELNMLAKQEDPYRLTIVASNQDNHNNDITDVIGFNKYYGWYGAKYGSTTNQIGEWADTWHKEFPNRAMAISEYGAGASIHHQSDSLVAPAPAGKWHPEQWQTKYHEDYWMQLKERPFIWGKFAWLMFDVAAAHRSEGDTNGLNDKGLVTEDRKTKKDAYYFYKANWNDSPMLYIAERRFKNRIESKTKIKVYTTLDKVKFYLNGKVVGTGKPESGIVISPEVILKKGENTIVVKGQNKSKKFEDQVIWNYN